MKTIYSILVIFLLASCFPANKAIAQRKYLKLVFIRHAERPDTGDNLTCRGFNRSLLLPALLYKKFGMPVNIYVPSLNMGEETRHSRMFQTITPFAIKYELTINSQYDEADYKHVGNALLKERGTVIIVWEHKNIAPIINYLGVKSFWLNWPDNDFDSIWIVTFLKGSAILTKDTENLTPSVNCPF
jgi:hypothetical protein